MLSDDLRCFFVFCKSAWNFACRFQLNRNTSPCNCFGWFALRFPEITYAEKPSVFLAAWNVKRETKETFCFGKRSSHYNTLTSHYCFVSASGRGDKPTGIEFVLSWHRLDTRSANFSFCSVSLLPSKTKISILKQIAYRARSGHSFFAQVIVAYESIEHQSKHHSDRRKRDVMH